MDRPLRLLIGYCIFFTSFNLSVSVLYYLYGFFFEKNLRKFDQLIHLPEKMLFMFHFKGIYGNDKINASRGGSLSQFGAIFYFIIMEIICFFLLYFIKDAVYPSRIAVFMSAILILTGVIRFVITNNKIKKNVKESDRIRVKNFVEEKAVDKDDAEVDSESILKEQSSQERRMEQVMYELWEEENDHENETVDAQEGLNEVKKLENDVIGDDYEISSGSVMRNYKTEAESLDAVKRNDEGVYSVSEFKDSYQQEFSPVLINNKKGGGEASGLEEGKKYLESLKNEGAVKNNKASSGTNDIEEGKKYLESLKNEGAVKNNKASSGTNDIEEGKKYLESLKNEGAAKNKASSGTNDIEEGKKYLESLKNGGSGSIVSKKDNDKPNELEEGKKYLENLNVMDDDF